ncbi:hypothetical protein WJX79_007931 [Trebouxia sp. C0005]
MSKKRFRPLGDTIRMGLIDDGALLRYVYKDQLMAVGRARQTGIEVPGLGILSAGKFEEHAGSKLHRPNQHTLAPSGKSLQDIMADSFEDGAGTSLHLPEKAVPTMPLMDDPNDDFCRVCGYGGDMLCCETCPATFHMECVGLTALPDGDWFCPHCVCAVCGQAHFESRALPATAKQVIWIDAEDTVASSTASASSARPMLHPPKPSAPATLPSNTNATPAPTTDAMDVNRTRALGSSTYAASTATGLPVNVSLQGKAVPDQAAGSGPQDRRKNGGELVAQTGPMSLGGSPGSVVQEKKRKVPEATGLPDTVPASLGKKPKSNNSDPDPAMGGPRSAAAGVSSMHEQLQRVASSAASPQAVQEALTAAFPPSQGSAKRAEKLKQFFSDVMPAGSGFKDRAAALAALASHLWQARNKATPSGGADNPGDMSTGVVDNLAAPPSTVADSSKQQSCELVHNLSDREHRMAASGRKHHFSCLSAQQQLQVVSDEEVWFSSPQHRQLSAELAGVCCRGPLPCGQVDESTPVTWQLIRGAAVADPQSCRGYAPKYSASQKGHLRQVLFAGRHVLLDCFGQLDDSRTSEDVIPWMLQGRCIGKRLLDFSGFHVAVLWVAGVMASVALVRAFGTPYLIKQLSADSIVKVKPFTQGLRLNPEADAEALAHSGLLIPCTPETVVKPEPTLDPEPHLNPEGPIVLVASGNQSSAGKRHLGETTLAAHL